MPLEDWNMTMARNSYSDKLFKGKIAFLICLLQPPHIPQVRHAGDASNFDDYSEEWLDEEESQLQVSTEQLDVFQDFWDSKTLNCTEDVVICT